ncbi:MAG: hypothetical protein Kow0063_22440 [Anaerolineae bacterium]
MNISRAEWVFAALLALTVLLVTGLPYLAGWLASTPDQVFEGFVIDIDDAHSHLAKMQQGYRGEWRYRILFTPEPHAGAYTNTLYMALGHLARLIHADLVATYHGARLVFGFFYLLTAYAFIASFLSDVSWRRLAFVLVCFSSGLGWLALLLSGSFVAGDITPVDFWFIEMYSFFTVMLFPHTSLAVALLLITFGLTLRYFKSGKLAAIAGAAASSIGVCVIHPFMLPVIVLVSGGYWLYISLRRGFRFWMLSGLAVLVLAPLPIVVYQYMAMISDPVFAGWQAQNINLSPPPWHYVSGYGVVLVLAIPGGWWALRRSEPWPFLPVWLLVVAFLLYAPVTFNLQRRVIEGVQVALCILATAGLAHYVLPAVGRSRLAAKLATRGYPPSRLTLLTRNLLVGLTLPSTLFLITSAGLAAASGPPDMFYSADELAAVDWLGANSSPDDTVLASYEIGGLIPARIGHRTFMGHWTETVDLAGKQVAASRFYGAASDGERQDMLRQYGIVYVFHGPRERALGDFDPASAPYLVPVFTGHDTGVYRVADLD